MANDTTGYRPGFSKDIDALIRVWREQTASGVPLIAWSEMRECLRVAGLPLGDDDTIASATGIDLSVFEMDSRFEYEDGEDDNIEPEEDNE